MLLLSAERLCRVQISQARARPYQAVLRGGGWNNNAPANRNDNIGFRCAKTPHPAVVAVPESLPSTDGGSVQVESSGLVLCSRVRSYPGAE